MSEGCKVCQFKGGPDPEHLEHAHRVALQLGQMLVDQQEKHKATVAILSGQKKNALLIRLGDEVARLKGELAQALIALRSSNEALRKQVLSPPAGGASCQTT